MAGVKEPLETSLQPLLYVTGEFFQGTYLEAGTFKNKTEQSPPKPYTALHAHFFKRGERGRDDGC